jgi:hypothetical protein
VIRGLPICLRNLVEMPSRPRAPFDFWPANALLTSSSVAVRESSKLLIKVRSTNVVLLMSKRSASDLGKNRFRRATSFTSRDLAIPWLV